MRRPESRRAELLLNRSNSCYPDAMDRRAKLLIKCVVTAFLFWLVADAVDLSRMSALLGKARPGWLLASLALALAITALDAFTFCIVMRILGHRMRFETSFLYSLVSWFFSNLAPSTVGGDIFRTAQMQRLGVPLGTALRSVLTARMMSFVTLIPVILLGLPIALSIVGKDIERMALILIAGFGVAAMFAVYGCFLLVPWLRRLERGSFAQRITALAIDFHRVNYAGWPTVSCWALASAQHVVRVAVLAALAASLQLGIPATTLFALVPAALLVAMVPISLGSWGLREAAFIVFLGGAGVAPEAALLLSVAWGLLRVIMGGLGGLTWLMADRNRYRFELDIVPDQHANTAATAAGDGGASTASTP